MFECDLQNGEAAILEQQTLSRCGLQRRLNTGASPWPSGAHRATRIATPGADAAQVGTATRTLTQPLVVTSVICWTVASMARGAIMVCTKAGAPSSAETRPMLSCHVWRVGGSHSVSTLCGALLRCPGLTQAGPAVESHRSQHGHSQAWGAFASTRGTRILGYVDGKIIDRKARRCPRMRPLTRLASR